jgi:hypothetical protein
MIIDTTRYITKLEMKKKKACPHQIPCVIFLYLKKKIGGFFSFGQREAGRGQVGGLG